MVAPVSVLSGSIFFDWQIMLIAMAAVLVVGLVALDVWFAFKFRIQAERKLYDDGLQNRRDALIAKLDYLKSGGAVAPQTWLVGAFGASDDDDDDDDEETEIVPTVDGKQPLHTVLLEVDAMTPRMRHKLGMRAKRFNGKRFWVRYALGFDAKLRYSDDETKAHYVALSDGFRAYAGITVEKNFSLQHIMFGNELLATVTFIGKRLCVAFALDPAEYENGKYHGEDKSDKKRFQRTPLVVRILSENKVEVAEYLMAQIAAKFGVEKGKVKKYKYDLAEKSQTDLVVSGAVRVVIVDEVPPGMVIPTQSEAAEAQDERRNVATKEQTAQKQEKNAPEAPAENKSDAAQNEAAAAESVSEPKKKSNTRSKK